MKKFASPNLVTTLIVVEYISVSTLILVVWHKPAVLSDGKVAIAVVVCAVYVVVCCVKFVQLGTDKMIAITTLANFGLASVVYMYLQWVVWSDQLRDVLMIGYGLAMIWPIGYSARVLQSIKD
ncbi:MAG: hypothetical protein LBK70_00715 [Clostridiales bacterium]|jgi:hypothetical protein|nr:hypothetical protein [Clostridiales bacterium]